VIAFPPDLLIFGCIYLFAVVSQASTSKIIGEVDFDTLIALEFALLEKEDIIASTGYVLSMTYSLNQFY
jgi:hypothetical protein